MKIKTLQWNIGGAKIRKIDADPTQEIGSLVSSYSEDGLCYIIEKLKGYNADILTLQETHADKNDIQSKVIAEQLGYTYWINSKYSNSHIEEGQDLCQTIISRYPISNNSFEYFKNPYFEVIAENGDEWISHDKGYTSSEITISKNKIGVGTLHLVPFPRFKREYSDPKVLEVLKDVQLKIIPKLKQVNLIQGDFNIDSELLGKYLPELSLKMSEVRTSEPTTPKGKRYDHVLYKGLNFIQSTIDKNVLTDHYPIISEFELL